MPHPISSGCSGACRRIACWSPLTDGHPATLAWLGAVAGHRTVPLGVEHFGQTGTIADLYRHFGLDADTIVSVAQNLSAGRPIKGLTVVN